KMTHYPVLTLFVTSTPEDVVCSPLSRSNCLTHQQSFERRSFLQCPRHRPENRGQSSEFRVQKRRRPCRDSVWTRSRNTTSLMRSARSATTHGSMSRLRSSSSAYGISRWV